MLLSSSLNPSIIYFMTSNSRHALSVGIVHLDADSRMTCAQRRNPITKFFFLRHSSRNFNHSFLILAQRFSLNTSAHLCLFTSKAGILKLADSEMIFLKQYFKIYTKSVEKFALNLKLTQD